MSHPRYAPTYNAPPAHPSHIGPFSSPNPGMANLGGQQQNVGDKRRNKLGYHRTTIACGHCRKRKIRCVPTLADVHGRCENCIRLKKECIFYPVDQPPPSEGQPVQLPKISPAPTPTGAVHPYPQAALGGNLGEMPANHSFSPLTQQASNVPTPTLKSDNAGLFALDTKASLPPATDQPFDFGGQPVTGWVPADANYSPGSKPADLNPTWRGYPESPVSAQFSPFGPTPPSGTWTPGSSETGSRDDMPWTSYPPPVRSMSYGGEPLAGHQSQYPPVPQRRQFDRRASALSDVYAPSMSVPVSGMETNVSGGLEPPGSLSARAAPPPPFGGWNEAQHAPAASTYAYPGWGHEEDGIVQPGFPEHGQQLGDNESPHGAYFATR